MEFDFLLRIVACWLVNSLTTYGFNVDVKNPIIFSGLKDSEYFGYSVALHSYSDTYWVIVGAPRSNQTTKSTRKLLERYGAVYRCMFTSPHQDACELIDIDRTPDATVSNTDIKMEVKTGMWLGGVVSSTGTNAMACAPRYVFRDAPRSTSEGYVHYFLPLGRCHLLQKDLSEAIGEALIPCENEGKSNQNYGYCQAGFSAEYANKGDEILMGAVGSKNARGVLFLRKSGEQKYFRSVVDQLSPSVYMGYSVGSGQFTDKMKTEYVGGAPRADGVKGKVIIYHSVKSWMSIKIALPQPKDLPTGTYFGSAIRAVDLNNDQYADLLVGAPYFSTVKNEGRVFIYLNNGKGALDLQDSVLEGDRKVGALFGYYIAAVGDLNLDKYEDVAIGAPQEDGFGTVYIYHGSAKGIELQYKQKILGSKFNPRLKWFGISISGGVDVDKNFYKDIAVGAYASEKAVILRSRNIVNVDGFIELSKQQISLEGNDSKCVGGGEPGLKCVNITIGFQFNDVVEKTNSPNLAIKYKVDLDKDKGQAALRRLFFWDEAKKERQYSLENNYTIGSRKVKFWLHPRTVYVPESSKIGDVVSFLTFDLSIFLPPCSGLCPVLNNYRKSSFRVEIPFIRKCKNEIACVPDLVLRSDLVWSPKPGEEKKLEELRIGVVKDFTVNIHVLNAGEDYAYTSKIILKYPANLDYIGPDQGVKCDGSTPDNATVTVTCDVGNPLQGKAKKQFGIKFSPGNVRESFVIEVEAVSQDKDANANDNKKKLPVTVKFEADIQVTGSSKQDRVVYSGPVRSDDEIRQNIQSIGPEVIQTVIVRNNGPSVAEGSLVTISYPHLYSSKKRDSYLLYLLQVDIQGAGASCDVKVNPLDIKEANNTNQEANNTDQGEVKSRRRRDTENLLLDCRKASCKPFQCHLGKLKVEDKVEIKMTFRLWQNTLLKELDPPKAVNLETSATVRFTQSEFTQTNTDNDETKIITTAKPAQSEAQSKKTPWWVIFLSVLGGVMLLAGAIVVLYKLGFFKRKRIKDISEPNTVEMSAGQ